MSPTDNTKRIDLSKRNARESDLAAQAKAANSAKALGVDIGEPLLLEEDLSPSEGWQNPQLTLNNLRVAGGEERRPVEALAPGTILPITIRVKAAFKLLPHAK